MPLRIFEAGGTGRTDGFPIMPDFIAKQSMTPGAASAQSSAFNAGTSLIVIQADEACHVLRGANPTATTADYKMLAGSEMAMTVRTGDKLAVIQA